MSADNVIIYEILKLLVQVAWADDDISEREAHHILTTAQSAGIGAQAFHELQAALSGQGKLPAPNLGLLREHAQEALASAEMFVRGGSEVAQSEIETLQQLRELLT